MYIYFCIYFKIKSVINILGFHSLFAYIMFYITAAVSNKHILRHLQYTLYKQVYWNGLHCVPQPAVLEEMS